MLLNLPKKTKHEEEKVSIPGLRITQPKETTRVICRCGSVTESEIPALGAFNSKDVLLAKLKASEKGNH